MRKNWSDEIISAVIKELPHLVCDTSSSGPWPIRFWIGTTSGVVATVYLVSKSYFDVGVVVPGKTAFEYVRCYSIPSVVEAVRQSAVIVRMGL